MTPSKCESSTTSCNCSNKCLQFENLTSDQGLLIALNIPYNNTNTTSTKECTCLKLHPEVDANLAQFHPNIYIPSSLLDYPDRLVKYGGGGMLFCMFMHNIICIYLVVAMLLAKVFIYLVVLCDLTYPYTLHFAIRIGSDSLWWVSSTPRITSDETRWQQRSHRACEFSSDR